MESYLRATDYFDYHHPGIQALAAEIRPGSATERAVQIYNLVRDRFPYNPFDVLEGPPSFRASFCVERGEAYCIPKAALMVALCRQQGIPARLGLADVKNHLSTPKMTEMLRSEIFSMHGYAEIWLDDRWIKTTPVFNRELCERFNVAPLEFDGQSDAIFHAYTSDGQRHMEYLTDHGSFEELPVDFILDNFARHYPHLVTQMQEHAGSHNEQQG